MTAATYRAVAISPLMTVVDDMQRADLGVAPTDPATWAQGMGALLSRLAGRMTGGGVLILDRAAAHALKLPGNPAERATTGLDDARAAGWLHGTPRAWTTFYGDGRPSISVGIESWPDFDRSPLVDRLTLDMVHRFRAWHDATGVPWSGTPGAAGLQVYRATAPTYPTATGSKAHPTQAIDWPPGVDEVTELAFGDLEWSRSELWPWVHGYDASRMYLAAAGVCESLAPWKLRHTGRTAFDPCRAGFWRVELGAWNDDRIPAPAGPGGPGTRWVTTPTLALLAELRLAGGAFQPYEVLDSWTAPGRRILREWSARLETAYQTARGWTEQTDGPLGRDQDGPAVMAAVKEAYREAWGLLKPMAGRPAKGMYRPDWHYAVIAQARSNLWRRMWSVGMAEGRWPLSVDVDLIRYGSDLADAEAACPAGIPLVDRNGRPDMLGTFKIKESRETR